MTIIYAILSYCYVQYDDFKKITISCSSVITFYFKTPLGINEQIARNC